MPEQSVATAEFALSPETFRTAALPAASQAQNDDYKGSVFALLEQAKRTLPGAEARGAKGVAVVTFLLDRAGNLVSVSLVRPTGDRDLDAEAIAMVRRAAPFPKPPEGALLTFAPLLQFGQE
jgi:protein TonB